MKDVYSLLKLFGERYVFCDDGQAMNDALPANRKELVSAYSAIMHYMSLSKSETVEAYLSTVEQWELTDIPFDRIYEDYISFCDECGYPSVSMGDFSIAIKDAAHDKDKRNDKSD